METVMNSVSFEERNQRVKYLVDTLLSKDDISNIFSESDDPFSLSKIGKTCILQWNTILEKYELFLVQTSTNYFEKKLQVRAFEVSLKRKIIFIFKFLIYLMKNTFNHELYIIDAAHANYLHSYDLDVSFNSFLFHNEFYNTLQYLHNKASNLYFNSLDLNFYIEKKFDISSDFNSKTFNFKYSFEKDNLVDLKIKISEYFAKNLECRSIHDFSIFYSDHPKIDLIYAEIFKYEYYKNSESQKLLAIEILANLLILKISFCYKLEVFLYSINMFLSSSLEDCLVDSLSMFADNYLLLAQYYNQTDETLLYNNIIEYLHYELKSLNFFDQNEIYSRIQNKFNIFCNYLYKDFIKNNETTKLLQKLDTVDISKIYPYICYILYDISFFKTFVNAFLKGNITQTFNIVHSQIDFLNTNIVNDPFKIYKDNDEYLILVFDILTNILVFLLNDSQLDAKNECLTLIDKFLVNFTQNIHLKDFIIADHINKKFLEILLYDTTIYLSLSHSQIFQNIFDYYFEKRNVITVISVYNILSLCCYKSNKYFIHDYPLYLEKIIEIYNKNPEFALFLIYFSPKKSLFDGNILAYLRNKEFYKLEIDFIIDQINYMNDIGNTYMDIFINYKKFYKLNDGIIQIESFLTEINAIYAIETWYYHEFHFGQVLALIRIILENKNLQIKFRDDSYFNYEIKIPDNYYISQSSYTIFDIKRLILNKYNGFSRNYLISQSFYQFVLEIKMMDFTTKTNFEKNSYEFFEYLLKVYFFLKSAKTNIKTIFCLKNDFRKHQIINEFIDTVAVIYKNFFSSIDLPHIVSQSPFSINEHDLSTLHNRIHNSKMNYILSVLNFSYILILEILLEFDKFSISNAYVSFNKPCDIIYFIHKLSSDMITIDPNLILFYYLHMSKNQFILVKYKFTELIRILEILTNHSVEYNSKHQIDLSHLRNTVLKILVILLNNCEEENKSYECLDTIFEFINQNIFLLTLKDFLCFLKEINTSVDEFDRVISNLKLFSKVLDLITKFDKDSVNPLIDSFTVAENTQLYYFLNESFLNLTYADFFIEAQKKHDSIFLLVHKYINQITDIKAYFNESVRSFDKYLKILITNIEKNISYKKSMEYKKMSLLLLNINDYIKEETLIFLYLISLVRLASYSNTISKSEIYSYYNILRVLVLIKTGLEKKLQNSDFMLECAYAYIRYLFEDEFYLISSFAYVVECYNGITDLFFAYFNQKLIYPSEIHIHNNGYSNLIKDEDIILKEKILIDFVNIINSESVYYKIFLFQFFSELIATFPSLLYILKKDIINDFINRLEFTYLLGEVFSGRNCNEWDLNFRFGYFITVSLYRGGLSYIKDVIERICLILKESDDTRSKNFISLIYKILASDICCCKYIQYLNRANPDFYDRNCKINIEKRKYEIFQTFLSNDILNIILSKCKGIINHDIRALDSKNSFIDLLIVFFEFIRKGKITIREKYLLFGIFKSYVLGSNYYLIPAPLIECEQLEVNKNKVRYKFFTKNYIKTFSRFKNIDFGYIMKYHKGICVSTDYNEVIFLNYEIYNVQNNFNADYIDDLKMIKKIFKLNELVTEGIKSSIETNLRKYNLPKYLSQTMNSKFYSRENLSEDENYDDAQYIDIFDSDALLMKKYSIKSDISEILTETHEAIDLSPSFDSYMRNQVFIYKNLTYLCIFSNKHNVFEIIEKIKRIICDECHEESSYKEFRDIFDTEVGIFRSNKQDSISLEKLEQLNKIVMFLIEKRTYMNDDLLINLFFFEIIYLEKDQRYFLECWFTLLELNQDLLNPNFFYSDVKNESIVLNIIKKQKELSKCVFDFLLNTIMVYSEKMKVFIVDVYFNQNKNENMVRITYFYKELNNILDLLNPTNYINSIENLRNILNLFHLIEKNPLKYFSNEYFNCKNTELTFVFINYVKIIVKCCQIYSFIREAIHENNKFKDYEKKFVFEDFICFLFDIDFSKMNIDEIISLENKTKLKDASVLFHTIKDILPNSNEIFFNLRCLSRKIKLNTQDNEIVEYIDPYGAFFIRIDRNNIIESVIDSFENPFNEHFNHQFWNVRFSNEEGRGIGLFYEFLGLYGKAINESKYFEPFRKSELNNIIVFPQEEHNKIKKIYYYTGVIIGKCIICNSTLGIDFYDHLYLYLIRKTLSIDDLKIIDKDFHKSLIFYKSYEDINSLYLFFNVSVNIGQEIKTFDLIENGSNIQVTKENLEEYIQKITEFKFFKKMKPYLDKLKKGFNSIFNSSFNELFTHLDLKITLEGEKLIDVKQWKAITRYSNEYNADHQVIKWFWNFVENSNEVKRKKLIYFITGLEYLPIEGFESSKFSEHPFKITSDKLENMYPRVQTCFNLLILPLYEDENTLIDRMNVAIEVRGYGFS